MWKTLSTLTGGSDVRRFLNFNTVRVRIVEVKHDFAMRIEAFSL